MRQKKDEYKKSGLLIENKIAHHTQEPWGQKKESLPYNRWAKAKAKAKAKTS